MKKFLTSFIVCMIIILNVGTVAQAATAMPAEKQTTDGRMFSVDAGYVESYETSEPVSAENVNVDINGGSAILELEINGCQLNYQIKLLPSQFGMYKGNTIIGIAQNRSYAYSVVNFRIERNANQIALMQDNLSLENKTVLFLGLYNSAENRIVYFQIELEHFDFDSIYNEVYTEFENSTYSSEDVERIEVSYLTMAVAKQERTSNVTTFTETGTALASDGNIDNVAGSDVLSDTLDDIKEMSKNGLINLDSRSLITGVPDNVFKSGDFDKWVHGWSGWNSKTGYMVYPMRYAGTENRLHYVMTFSISQSVNFDTQKFDMGFKVTNNCWVLYNIYNRDLGVFDSSARIAVDPEVWYKSNSQRGVFTRSYYTFNKEDSMMKNIAKVIIAYIPYLSNFYDSYETLTAKESTLTNKVYPYPDNYDNQKAQGELINELHAGAEGLKAIRDYLYMELTGSEIQSVTYNFTYSVYDPVWW